MIEFVNLADILAIPSFLVLLIFFITKENRNFIENILLIFSFVGLLLDTYFTIIYFKNKKNN